MTIDTIIDQLEQVSNELDELAERGCDARKCEKAKDLIESALDVLDDMEDPEEDDISDGDDDDAE